MNAVALPAADAALVDIAEYAANQPMDSALAYEMACHCLMDALASGFRALHEADCLRLLGPLVPGATMTQGARVPGTSYELDPVTAAFNIGTMVCWQRDPAPATTSRPAGEGLHPSDTLGAILAVGDYLARRAHNEGRKPPRVRDLLSALIKAHEIQGVLALDPSVDRAGLDQTMLVRVAAAAAVTALLGGDRDQILDAISHAWIDGGSCSYRHVPTLSARKRWAAGDAGSRAVRLAFLALSGERGYPSALSAPRFGLYDALLGSQPFSPPRPYASHMMEHWRFEGLPPQTAPFETFAASVAGHFGAAQAALIQSRFADSRALLRMPVNDFGAMLVKNG
jgi:2-methylcitrate dehydratase